MTGRIWVRAKDDPFSKTARLNDGEWSRFLWSLEGASDEKMIEASYDGFAKLDEQRNTSIKAMAFAYFVLGLAYFEILGDANAGGLTLRPEYLDVVALFLATVVGLQFALIDSKHSFYQTLFAALYDRAGASRRTELVARYPAAFNVLHFSRHGRSYPDEVFPASILPGIVFPIVMLVLMLFGLIGMILLAVMIGIGIWNSTEVPEVLAKGAVILALLAAGVVILIPRHWPIRRLYHNFSFSQLFERLKKTNPDKWEWRHRQVAEIRVRAELPAADERD